MIVVRSRATFRGLSILIAFFLIGCAPRQVSDYDIMKPSGGVEKFHFDKGSTGFQVQIIFSYEELVKMGLVKKTIKPFNIFYGKNVPPDDEFGSLIIETRKGRDWLDKQVAKGLDTGPEYRPMGKSGRLQNGSNSYLVLANSLDGLFARIEVYGKVSHRSEWFKVSDFPENMDGVRSIVYPGFQPALKP